MSSCFFEEAVELNNFERSIQIVFIQTKTVFWRIFDDFAVKTKVVNKVDMILFEKFHDIGRMTIVVGENTEHVSGDLRAEHADHAVIDISLSLCQMSVTGLSYEPDGV